MLTPAVIGSSPSIELDVGYIRPGELRAGGARSDEHEIEYQHDDAPDLAEGAPVVLALPGGSVSFKVREPPYVSDLAIEGRDGFFWRAKLTRLG